MDHVKFLSQSINVATGAIGQKMRHMDESLNKFIFNSSNEKVQKHISQTVKTHKRSGIVALKIVVSKTTQADAEAARLAKKRSAKYASQNFRLRRI